MEGVKARRTAHFDDLLALLGAAHVKLVLGGTNSGPKLLDVRPRRHRAGLRGHRQERLHLRSNGWSSGWSNGGGRMGVVKRVVQRSDGWVVEGGWVLFLAGPVRHLGAGTLDPPTDAQGRVCP